jgi:hypothetical protein
MKMLKKLWNKLSGWKSLIAGIFLFIQADILPIWYPLGIPEPYNKIIATTGVIILMIAGGHKSYKWKKENK